MKVLSFGAMVYALALMILPTGSPAAGGTRVGEGGTVSQGAARTSNLLDGKTFVAQSGEKGKKASNKDTIVFRDGRFLSEGCLPWNFGDAAYEAAIEGEGVRFHAETRSPTHGTMVWDGIIRGDAIEAANVWTRERWYWTIKREYWYRGALKK